MSKPPLARSVSTRPCPTWSRQGHVNGGARRFASALYLLTLIPARSELSPRALSGLLYAATPATLLAAPRRDHAFDVDQLGKGATQGRSVRHFGCEVHLRLAPP